MTTQGKASCFTAQVIILSMHSLLYQKITDMENFEWYGNDNRGEYYKTRWRRDSNPRLHSRLRPERSALDHSATPPVLHIRFQESHQYFWFLALWILLDVLIYYFITSVEPAKPTKQFKEGTCVVCLEYPCDTVLYRCGHLCCCFSCARALKVAGHHCPVCRAEVSDILRIYRST